MAAGINLRSCENIREHCMWINFDRDRHEEFGYEFKRYCAR